MELVNTKTGKVIVSNIRIMDTFTKRLLGYMFRTRPLKEQAMFFPGVKRVHTLGMRFPIKILFMDGDMRVLEILSSVDPNSFPVSPEGTGHIVEIPDDLETGLEHIQPDQSLALRMELKG
jgi:uncharacterized membrane protein (UPF0127 family)